MAVLGVIFIVLAIGLGGAAFWVATSAGAAPTTVDMFNNQLSLTPLTMFLLGVASTLLLLLGFWMMTSAGKRRVRRTQERRTLEKQQREQERELAQTRAKLSAGSGTSTGTTATTGTTGGVTERASTTPSPGRCAALWLISSTSDWLCRSNEGMSSPSGLGGGAAVVVSTARPPRWDCARARSDITEPRAA